MPSGKCRSQVVEGCKSGCKDRAVVRTWAVDSQELERKLKSLKNSPRLCPIRNPELADQVQNEYARMKWELDHSVYNPDLPLPL
jgi:hypothetical protein